jgi:hypothetical protein
MEQKLSELMKQGAAVLAPFKGGYFDAEDEPEAACAIGCALYAARKFNVDNVIDLYSLYDDDYLDDVDITKLPTDIQIALTARVSKDPDNGDDCTWDLHGVIILVNDRFSRARAIEITEMLGY